MRPLSPMSYDRTEFSRGSGLSRFVIPWPNGYDVVPEAGRNQRLDPAQAPAPTPDRFATEFGWNFSANILVRHGCNSPQLGERSLEINATLWTLNQRVQGSVGS
jgi:hypothetical protein